MSSEARTALNEIEDSETNPQRPPKRTFGQALEAAQQRGDKWFIWNKQQFFVSDPDNPV